MPPGSCRRCGATRARSTPRRTFRARCTSTSTTSPTRRAPCPTCCPIRSSSPAACAGSASATAPGSCVYDNNNYSASARAWWMLRVFGHADVAVLDGGLAKWRAEGRPVDDRAGGAARGAFHGAPEQSARARSGADARQSCSSRREQVVDARSRGRFAGTEPEPRAGLRGGHIPGSLSLPHLELIARRWHAAAPAELRRRFAAAGVDLGPPIVTSCGSGVTASTLALALYQLGATTSRSTTARGASGAGAATPRSRRERRRTGRRGGRRPARDCHHLSRDEGAAGAAAAAGAASGPRNPPGVASDGIVLPLSLCRGGRALELDRSPPAERCRARRDPGRSARRGERALARGRAGRLCRAGSTRPAGHRARLFRADARVHRPGARRLSAGLGDPSRLARAAAPAVAAYLRPRSPARARLLSAAGFRIYDQETTELDVPPGMALPARALRSDT